MLKASPIPGAEEWAIHDYEGFEELELSEWEGFEQLAEKSEFLAEHGRLGARIAAELGGDLKEACEAMEERYHGQWDSMEAFAENLTHETGELDKLPHYLARYIDFAAMGRDMEIEGWLTIEADGETHIFSPGLACHSFLLAGASLRPALYAPENGDDGQSRRHAVPTGAEGQSQKIRVLSGNFTGGQSGVIRFIFRYDED